MFLSNPTEEVNMQTTHELFLETFNHIGGSIPFNPEWNNGTGYFDKLAEEHIGLPIGTRFSVDTGGENNRKIVGIVTPVGNVVFFERYTAGESGVICLNLPRALSGLYKTGRQSAEIFDLAVGGVKNLSDNIGQVLDHFVEAGLKSAKLISA